MPPGGTSGKESACNARDCKRLRLEPWVGKIPWRRHGNPLQHSCLENPRTEEPGRLQSIGLQSWTQLKRLSRHTRRSWNIFPEDNVGSTVLSS